MKKRIFAAFLTLLLIICLLVSCKSESKDLKTIDFQLTTEHYAFGVNKEDTSLLTSANELITQIKNDGTLDSIVNKYFSNDTSKIKTFDGGEYLPCKDQLVVATHVPFSPFEYKIGDRYCGIDIEIASLLAEKLDKELVIKEYHFSEILTAVEDGDADIVMAGLTVSTDREKQVDFTDAYFDASQILIAKKTDTTFDNCQTTSDVVEILSKMNKSTKIGYQKDTVSQSYVQGNNELGFIGLNTDSIGYNSVYDASKALKNGEIDYVIVDEGPAKMIVNTLNQQNK